MSNEQLALSADYHNKSCAKYRYIRCRRKSRSIVPIVISCHMSIRYCNNLSLFRWIAGCFVWESSQTRSSFSYTDYSFVSPVLGSVYRDVRTNYVYIVSPKIVRNQSATACNNHSLWLFLRYSRSRHKYIYSASIRTSARIFETRVRVLKWRVVEFNIILSPHYARCSCVKSVEALCRKKKKSYR